MMIMTRPKDDNDYGNNDGDEHLSMFINQCSIVYQYLSAIYKLLVVERPTASRLAAEQVGFLRQKSSFGSP